MIPQLKNSHEMHKFIVLWNIATEFDDKLNFEFALAKQFYNVIFLIEPTVTVSKKDGCYVIVFVTHPVLLCVQE